MRSAMDRAEAARLLGVDPACSPRQADKAFKALVRERHPDRYPPGSEAWEDASALMPLLTETRARVGTAGTLANEAEAEPLTAATVTDCELMGCSTLPMLSVTSVKVTCGTSPALAARTLATVGV